MNTFRINPLRSSGGLTRGRLYWPQLDGVRTLAVAAVLALHGTYGKVKGGFLGVDLFFVLSGFLITTLLANEIERSGKINFRLFYIRRFLRLYPALVLLVIGAGAFWSLQPTPGLTYARMALAALFYHANFVSGISFLAHVWSLSIEEQFYIVWPFLLTAIWSVRGRKWYLLPMLLMIGSAILVRWVMAHDQIGFEQVYRSPFARMDSLVMGATFALTIRRVALVEFSEAHQGAFKALGALGLTIFLILVLRTEQRSLEILGFTTVSLVFGLFLTSVVLVGPRDSLLNRFLSSGPMKWIGRRSYGIYLYHLPVFVLCERFRTHHSLANLIGVSLLRVAVTMVVATLSYELVEKRFLALKDRFEPDEGPAARIEFAEPQRAMAD